MGIGDKIKNFIAPEEEVEELELNEEEVTNLSHYEKPRLESGKLPANANIILFEPRRFEDAQEIGMHIKNKRACAINLHRLPSEYRQRIIDFLTGVIFALDGSINKVGENVILASPNCMPVGGNINLNNDEER